MKHALNLILVIIATVVYASVRWYDNLPIVNWITSTQYNRPFVYRQLVPFLARGLSEFVRIDFALIFIVTLAGVGLYVAIYKLGKHFGIHNELWALLVTLSGLILFGDYRASYDVMTACLWAWALLFMFQHDHKKYTLLFPILCFNRIETSIFLIILWAIFYPREIVFLLYQITVFVSMYLVLHLTFAENTGASAWVEPLENLQRFIHNPLLTMFHIYIFVLLMYVALRNWNKKDGRLRLAFVLLVPIFLGLYFVFGQAFEIRVFWEVVPVVGAMLYG